MMKRVFFILTVLMIGAVGSMAEVLFEDNFSTDLSKWTKYGGEWAVSNGTLYANYGINCGSKGCPQAELILNSQYQPSDNYKASIDFTRIVDATHSDYYQSNVQFSIWKSINKKISIGLGGAGWNSWGGMQTEVRISVQNWNGSWNQILNETHSYNWNPDSWNTASIVKDGANYSLYINDTLLTTFTDSFLNGEGKLGLHTYGTKSLDNFKLESTTTCNDRYNEGYTAGKQYCISNPSACGITTGATTVVSSEDDISIAIKSDWQLVGVSGSIKVSDFSSFFDSSCVSEVYYFNGSWYHYIPGSTSGQIDIGPDQGFWVKGKKSCTLTNLRYTREQCNLSYPSLSTSDKAWCDSHYY